MVRVCSYKFVLVMSNSLCDGFTDEKLEDAYVAGAVPIVLGARCPGHSH